MGQEQGSMVQTSEIYTRYAAADRRDAYQSIDPKFWECRAVDVPAVAIIDGSYSHTYYLYLRRYPFYVPKNKQRYRRRLPAV